MQSDPSLDELFFMVAYIYAPKNLERTTEATFAHFIEVCAMLTAYDRKYGAGSKEVLEALCKALGWFFPLLAKLQIKSLEQIVFEKFPRVCPYCNLPRHNPLRCKYKKRTAKKINYKKLERFFAANWDNRPTELDEWRKMFQKIYPRKVRDRRSSTVRLLEEVGELAEAIRVVDKNPDFLRGEAADVFSHLMGVANSHFLRLGKADRLSFSLQREFISRYPGKCIECHQQQCVCEKIPEATVGRLAEEFKSLSSNRLGLPESPSPLDRGKAIATRIRISASYGDRDPSALTS